MKNLIRSFEQAGGEFFTPAGRLLESLNQIRAFIFDWDGVFNTGQKGEGLHSGFAEPDSMGINLLRFGYWLKHGGEIPVTAIVTGLDNPSARNFAIREHLFYVFSGYKHKIEAIQYMCATHKMEPGQIAFCFDDVLDLSVAKVCGLRFLVRRNLPVFMNYLKGRGFCDYITANHSGEYAVREICELLLSLQGNYDQTLDMRVAYADKYVEYLDQRNAIECSFL